MTHDGDHAMSPEGDEIESLRRQARLAIALGRATDAAPLLRRILAVDPADLDSLKHLLSHEISVRRDFDSASELLQRGMRLGNPDACSVLAAQLVRLDPRRARLEPLVEAVLARTPDDAAYRLAAEALAGSGEAALRRAVEQLTTLRDLSVANELLKGVGDRPELMVAPLFPGSRLPLWIRFGTSDFNVAAQVLLEQHYSCVRKHPEVRSLIDAGANIGASSRWFAERHPHATILAIEPDESTIELLRRNVAHLPQVQVLQGGLWSHDARLSIRDGGDGQPWARVVTESPEGDLEAFSMESLLDLLPDRRCDVLKVDIEGAESVVFRDAARWIDAVRTVAIECHGPGEMAVVQQAIVPPMRLAGQQGEIMMFERA